MSEARKARFKAAGSLMHSADQKRSAWDARTKKKRGQLVDSKRGAGPDSADSIGIEHAILHLSALCEGDAALQPDAVPHLHALYQFISAPNAEILPLLERGLVAVLARCLSSHSDGNQLGAAQCITIVASGDHSQTSLLYPLVPAALELLSSERSNIDVKTQLCWTIGNIAVDCSVCKATLVQLRCPQHIFSLLANLVRYYQQGHSGATSSSLIANLLWAMTNLVRGNIDVGYYAEFEDEDVRRLLWLYTVQDEGIAPLARWLFTFLSAKSQDIFDRLLALGLYDCVVHSLENEIQSASCLSASMDSATVSILSTAHKDNADEEGQLAAIRCLGNLCAGSEVCAHAALHHPALPTKLVVCLDSALYSKWVAKEALRTLSYLLNGASEAQQQHTLGGVINEFMTAWHRNVLSEDHDAQEASLLAIESLHPSLSLSFYEEKDAKTLDDILYTLVKLVLSPTTATLCQIAVLALLKTWLGYCPAVVAPRLVQMDVAESLENLHYTSKEVAVTALAQEVIDALYKYMEEDEEQGGNGQKEEAEGSADRTVFNFALPTDNAMPSVATGRGMHTVQPAWMTNAYKF